MDVITQTKETLSGVAGGLYGGAKDIAGQTWRGWENTREQIELPDWMQKVLRTHEEIGGERKEGGGSGGPEPPKESRAGMAAGAVAGSVAARHPGGGPPPVRAARS